MKPEPRSCYWGLQSRAQLPGILSGQPDVDAVLDHLDIRVRVHIGDSQE